MPPTCCRCNASGCCKNCSCKKSKKVCSNCQPSRLGKCVNEQQPNACTDVQATMTTSPSCSHTNCCMLETASEITTTGHTGSTEETDLTSNNRLQAAQHLNGSRSNATMSNHASASMDHELSQEHVLYHHLVESKLLTFNGEIWMVRHLHTHFMLLPRNCTLEK